MTRRWIAGTGFSRGIGFEFAKQIQAQNYKILHIGRKPCGFEDEFLPCDLSKPLSIECMEPLQSKLQDKTIAGFFYGAGIFPLLTYEENNSEQKEKFWNSQKNAMQINYLSCAQLIEEILPFLLKESKVNTKNILEKNSISIENADGYIYQTDTLPFIAYLSSLAAVDPLPGFELYGITKLATLRYFKNLSERFNAHQLLCLSIHPGTVKTDMTAEIIATENPRSLMGIEILKNAHKEKQMLSAKESAHLIADFLFDSNYSDMRKSSHGQLFLADTKQIVTNQLI